MMKKILVFCLAIIAIGFSKPAVGQACQDIPIINSFEPNTGFIGSLVTVFGANFDATNLDNNVVYFGATKAVVVSATFGQLEVVVPVGASTAPISVTNQCDLTAYSKVAFNGLFCPTPLNSQSYDNVSQELGGVYGAYNMLSQDMDLDGKPEVISSRNNGGITIAVNNSTPGNLSFTAYNQGNGGGQSIVTADFDGDGLKDVLYTYGLNRNTSTGPGNVQLANAVGIPAISNYQVAAGDFNNDGKVDIIGQNGNWVRIAFNTSTGPGNISFTGYQDLYDVGPTCTGIQAADIDGDGKTDFISSQRFGNRAVSLRNTTANGSFTASFEAPEYWASDSDPTDGLGTEPYRSQLADFDKDGKIDFTSCNFAGNTNTAIWRNISTVGDINFAPTVNLPAPIENYRIQVGDVDGDGYPDIVTKSLGDRVFAVYRNSTTTEGVITFDPRIEYRNSPAAAEVSGIVIGDLDGDFVPDIATSGINTNTIRFHRNTSAQVDTDPPTALAKDIVVGLSPAGTITITPADVDNGSSDACGLDRLELDKTVFTCDDIGENVVELTAYDNAGNATSVNAIVNVQPAAIIVSGQSTVCAGETIPMTANTGDSYQWFKDEVAIIGATNQTYSAGETGAYTVAVTNAGGCSGTSVPTDITISGSASVVVTATSDTYCVGVTLTSAQGALYQWSKDGVEIQDATLQAYVVDSPGNYSVEVVDLFGCTASGSYTILADTQAPTISLNGPATMVINQGDLYNEQGVSVVDNCGYQVVTTGTVNPNNIEVYTLTYQAIDDSGNASSLVSREVTVVPASISIEANGETEFCPGGSVELAFLPLAATKLVDEASVQPVAAIGMRKLIGTYNGPAIRIRRASDNTAQDFGFSGTDLDTDAIDAFLGDSQGYVFGLYDQSGNGNDFIQTNEAAQPFYIKDGFNGKPTFSTASGTRRITNNISLVPEFTVIYGARQIGPSRGRMLSSINNNWLLGWWGGYKNQYYSQGWVGGPYGAAGDNTSYVYSGTGAQSTDNYQFFINSQLSASNTGGSQGPAGLALGAGGTNSYEPSDGLFTDLVAYNTVLSTEDRELVEEIIGSYYGIFGTAPTTASTYTPELQWMRDGNTIDGATNEVYAATESGNYTVDLNVNGTIVSSNTIQLIAEDEEAPVLTMTGTDLIVELGDAYTEQGATVTDNCDNPTVEVGGDAVNTAVAGFYTVTYDATDVSENVAIQLVRVVEVQDNTNPVAVAQDVTVYLDANGNASVTPEQVNNGSSDASNDITLSLDQTAFECSQFGVSCSGSSIAFNGTGIASGANGDNIQNLGLDQLTMEAWVKPNGGTVNSIIRKAGDYDLYIANNTLYAEVWYEGRASSAQYWYTGPSVSDNVWSHLAFTFDKANNGSGKFYVNGVETAASGASRSITPDITLGIGGSTEYGQSFTGLIDDVRIWSVERTNAEINEFKDFCIDASSVGLEAYFKIEANEGTTLTDYSGNGNHLTITGTSWSFEGAPIGSQGVEVTLTVTDASNNSATATATVTVLDIIAPTLVDVPADITVEFDAVPAVATVTATDNCPDPAVTFTEERIDGINNNNYTLTRTWSTADASGNAATATQVITVEDATAPTVITKDITVQLDENGNASIVATDVDNGSSDNSGSVTLSIDRTDFDCNDIGSGDENLMNGALSGGVADVESVIGYNGATNYRGTNLGSRCAEAWFPRGTLCDDGNEGPLQNTRTDTNAGVTWRNITPGSSYGSMVVDLGSTNSLNNASVFQMFSDGKVTHIQGWYHPDQGATAPADNDPGWVEMFPYSAVGAGVLTGNTVTEPLQLNFPTVQSRYVKYHAWNDGTLGSGSWIEVRSIKIFGPANEVTLTVTDASGNEATGTATVTVEDNISPEIIAPADINLFATGAAGAVVSYTAPEGTDNCTVTTALTAGFASGATFPIGTTLVTYTATDASGNATSASFNVNVTGLPPEIVVPANITVSNDAGVCEAVVNYAASETTGIPASVITYDIMPGSSFAVGTTTVTATATNPVGTSTQAFTVTVVDNIAPVITGPADINVFATSAAGAVVNYATPVGTDNCMVTTDLTTGLADGATFPIGTTLVTFTATDASGNIASASFNVTVTGIAPEIVVPANITVSNDAGVCEAVVSFVATETTAIPASVITYDILPGSSFAVGTTTVTATATNPVGTSTQTFTVTVEDNELPEVITQNMVIDLDANGNASITAAQIDAGSTDNCGVASTVLSQTFFDCSNVGENTVTLTVTDIHNNVQTGTATVTVNDVTAAEIDAHDITVQLDTFGNFSLDAGDLLSTGEVDPREILNAQRDVARANAFLRRNQAREAAYENQIQQQNTEIEEAEAVVAEAQIGVDAGNATLSDAQAALENATTEAEILTATQDVARAEAILERLQGRVNALEARVVSLQGLAEETGQRLEVTQAATQELAVALAEAEAALEALENPEEGIFGTTSDACGIETITASQLDFDCANVGPNTVTLTVTDVNDNVSTVDVIVTVEDNVKPTVITTDITVQLDENGNASITAADINDGSNDACGILSTSIDISSFDCTNINQVNTVTLTVTDNNGNVETGTATVTVEDNVKPTVITTDITIELDETGNASIAPADINNGSNDACGILSTTIDVSTFTCVDVFETNVVTLTVTDNNGNVETGTAIVTVKDVTAPIVITQPITVALDANGEYTITPEDVDGGTTDACTFTLSLDNNAFNCGTLGENTVMLTATDPSGNSSTAPATVTVIDNAAPTIVTNPITVQLDENGAASILAGQVDGGTYDNCAVASVTIDISNFVCEDLGDNTVTITATDVNGNVSTAAVNVEVIDIIPPTLAANDITVELDENGNASIVPAEVVIYDEDDIIRNTECDVDATRDWAMKLGGGDDDDDDDDDDDWYKKRSSNDLDMHKGGKGRGKGKDKDDDDDDDKGGDDDDDDDDEEAGGKYIFDANGGTLLKRLDGTLLVTGTLVNSRNANDSWTISMELAAGMSWDEWDALGRKKRGNRREIRYQYQYWTYHVVSGGTLTGAGTNAGQTFDLAHAPSNIKHGFQLGTWANNETSAEGLRGSFKAISGRKTIDGELNLEVSNCALIPVPADQVYTQDNCSIVDLSFDQDSFTCTDIASTTVNLTATDQSGNATTVPVNVTVLDNIAPTAIAQNIEVSLGADGTVTIDPAALNGGSYDNTECLTFTLDRDTFTCDDVTYSKGKGKGHDDDDDDHYGRGRGHNYDDDDDDNDPGNGNAYGHKKGRGERVTLTVTDAAGNTDQAVAYVVVKDDMGPEMSAEPVTVVVYGRKRAYLSKYDVALAVSDNCKVKSIYFPRTRYDRSDVGMNTVTVTATDYYGNTTMGIVNVNVVDITNLGKRIEICYNGQSRLVSRSKVQSYLRKGAQLGSCGTDLVMSTNKSAFGQDETEREPAFEPLIELGAFPNPSQYETTITFSSEVEGPANVTVVTTGGMKLTTLFDGDIAADENVTVKYNTATLPNGIYIVRLVTAGEIRNLKLMVRK